MKISTVAVVAVVAVVGYGAITLFNISGSGGSSSQTAASAVNASYGCAGQSVGGSGATPVWASIPSGSSTPPTVQALRRGAGALVAVPAATVPPVVTVPGETAAPTTAPNQPSSATPTLSTAQPAGVQPASFCDSSYTGSAAGARPGGGTAAWDPGNIISDQVFYNSAAMTVDQIRSFIQTQNAPCPSSNTWCLRNLRISFAAQPADQYCQAVPAGVGVDAATAISEFSTACQINPQVMLVTLQKESQGLTRADPSASNYDAAWGWNCPDTGPGGTANCDPAGRGFFLQGYQMAKQWSKYRQRIPKSVYPYQPGKTVTVLWNVEESGCGGAPVTIRNIATASLYVYTPYQPNAASLAAYPGEGDKCSSYGNRNFFRMFQQYFGDTGGGLTPTGVSSGRPVSYTPGADGLGPVAVIATGNLVTIPSVAHVPTNMQGQTITAPSPAVAGAIAAGLTWLGTPYSWGGGGAGGPSTGICGPDGAENDCHVTGFDCSGLTRYVASKFGASIPQVSGEQRDPGHAVPWSAAQPGDIVGYSGHVTIFIGTFNGVRMQLEAPYSGAFIQISNVGNAETPDSTVYRYWNGSAV